MMMYRYSGRSAYISSQERVRIYWRNTIW